MRRRSTIAHLAVLAPTLIAVTFACAPGRAAPQDDAAAESAAAATPSSVATAAESEAAADTAEECRLLVQEPVPASGNTSSAAYAAVLAEQGRIRRFDCPFHGDRRMWVEAPADSEFVVRTLRVAAPADGEPQELRVESEEDPMPVADAGALLSATDLDRDGYRDLMLMTRYGATGNAGHEVWLFDPRTGRFVREAGLSDRTNLRPVDGGCWESNSVGGHAGRIYVRERLCRVDGRVVVVRSEDQDWDYDRRHYLRTTRERRGDTLAVVRADTVPDDAR